MKKNIHICIITSAHPVDDVRVNYKIGQSLIKEGFSISWVGPLHQNIKKETISNSQYKFKLFKQREGKFGRLLGGINLLFYCLKLKNIDIFYAPDPDSALVGVLINKFKKSKVIFDIHEIYHDAMLKNWINNFSTKFIKKAVQRVLLEIINRCDLVIGVNKSVLRPYESSNSPKIILRNCSPIWFASNENEGNQRSIDENFIIMHGKASFLRGTLKVLEALQITQQKNKLIKCIMIDDFNQNSKNNQKTQFIDHMTSKKLGEVVSLIPKISLEDMPALLNSCNAGIIAYGRNLGVESLPNRLFEYMAAGIPIIAPSYSHEIAEIIQEENCGVLVDFEDTMEVANTFVDLSMDPVLCADMGRKAKNAFLTKYNWEVEVEKLLTVINNW